MRQLGQYTVQITELEAGAYTRLLEINLSTSSTHS